MRIAHLACAIAAACGANAALAQWETVPDVTFAVGANDNPRLTDLGIVGEESGTARSAWIDARVRFSNFTERGGVFFEPRFRTDSYADTEDEELESQDFFLNSLFERRTAAGSRGGLRSYLSRESILSSELLDAAPIDPDLEEPIPIDTGILERPEEHRKRVLLAPFLESRLSQRSSLVFDARFQDVSYSGPELSDRTDFKDMQLGAGIARNVNDRNRATARFIISDFEADATSNQTDSVAVEGAFERTLSDIWSFALTTGLQRSEMSFLRDGIPDQDVDTSVTLGLAFRKRTELARLNLDLERLVAPTSTGYLERRNQLVISLDRRMTERLTADFGLRLVDTSTLGDIRVHDREYARFSFGISWAVRPQWSLDFGVGSIRQEITPEGGTGDSATSNRLQVGMTYRGLSRRGSF